MDMNSKELEIVKQADRASAELAVAELTDLQLVMIGGGGGPDVIFG